ncbi:MAG: hypothetical protein KatS3mg035_1542 [Bacteroidia bacterium]|nr:MAG: hypothetical protein KatS3mg035_1542 [Bacteroidia bacterium]
MLVPEEKQAIIAEAYEKIEEITMNYEMGLITDNERYNQVIDTWSIANTHLATKVLSVLKNDQEGLQLRLYDVGLRSTWFQRANQAIGRYERING